MKILLIGFCLVGLILCTSVAIDKQSGPSIVGLWCLSSSQPNYPTIRFQADSIAEFGSRLDTVYTFKYYLKGGYVNVMTGAGKMYRNKIVKLTDDSLVFQGLLELKQNQIYHKCKK
ncbi:MAG TPA: hypothetical protein VGQ51_06570 [Puia sp.]|jgi:hypothetical protein|nr:hypothetical protein [Puia sp.]